MGSLVIITLQKSKQANMYKYKHFKFIGIIEVKQGRLSTNDFL